MSIERSIIQKLRESREVEDEELLDDEFEMSEEEEDEIEESEDCDIEDEVVEECDEPKKRTPLEESIVRRLTESWIPALNKLRGPEKDIVRRELTKAGIDIENAKTRETYITSGRDPRIKGLNVIVIELAGGEVAVWFRGKFIIDPLVKPEWMTISKFSWKHILQKATRITSIEFDDKKAQELKSKRDQRAESQKGVVQRFTPKNKPRYTQIDKSGYIVDPNKYKNMLAKMKVNNGTQVLQQAKDMYTKLANNIDKIDWANDNDYYNYDTVMRGIVRGFQDLTRCLNEYEKYKKNPVDGEDADKWWGNHLENQVVNAIKEMRDILNKGKKYL